MTEKKRRGALLERAAELFDLPGEALAGMPRLALTGNKRLHVEGHKGILEYDHSIIAINGGAVIIKILGDKLEIISMNAEELLISGNVQGIEFD